MTPSDDRVRRCRRPRRRFSSGARGDTHSRTRLITGTGTLVPGRGRLLIGREPKLPVVNARALRRLAGSSSFFLCLLSALRG